MSIRRLPNRLFLSKKAALEPLYVCLALTADLNTYGHPAVTQHFLGQKFSGIRPHKSKKEIWVKIRWRICGGIRIARQFTFGNELSHSFSNPGIIGTNPGTHKIKGCIENLSLRSRIQKMRLHFSIHAPSPTPLKRPQNDSKYNK